MGALCQVIGEKLAAGHQQVSWPFMGYATRTQKDTQICTTHTPVHPTEICFWPILFQGCCILFGAIKRLTDNGEDKDTEMLPQATQESSAMHTRVSAVMNVCMYVRISCVSWAVSVCAIS